MASNFVKRLAFVALAAVLATPLAAQQRTYEQIAALSPEEFAKVPDAELRAALQLQKVVLATSLSQPFFRGAPGTSSGSPSGFGAAWRDAFVGGGVQQLLSGGTSDGSMSTGFGLGNAKDAIGFETVISSLSSFRSGLFQRTALSFKAHHMVSSTAGIALGVENAVITNGKQEQDKSSIYLAASKVVPFTSGIVQQATFSAGIGNGRFRFLKDQKADNKTVNAFVSAGFQVHEQASVLADWGGSDLTLGVSLVPFKQFPIVFTPAFADLTQGNARFSLGTGIGMRF